MTHSDINSVSFLCFTPSCLVLYYAICFTFLFIFCFVLLKSIWLAFVLSRDVFVLTHINAHMFSLTPRHYCSRWKASMIVSSSERTCTFRALLTVLPTLATYVVLPFWYAYTYICVCLYSTHTHVPACLVRYVCLGFGSKLALII